MIMGKRNRSANRDCESYYFLDTMPCSSGTEILSGEKSSHSVDSVELKHLASVMDTTDNSIKLHTSQHSTGRHHHNLSHSIFLKRSRHYYGYRYSRRNSINHASPSTSQANNSPRNERLSFKLATHCNSESGHRAENVEKAYRKRERIRSSSLIMEAASTDMIKMVCGICQKQLRRKACILGDTLSSSELSVVAVLVCGHIYHADCLGQKTCPEDVRDPPCLLCLSTHKD